MASFTVDAEHPIVISSDGAHLDGLLHIPNGATHLFEEPATLDKAAHLAKMWFTQYLS